MAWLWYVGIFCGGVVAGYVCGMRHGASLAFRHAATKLNEAFPLTHDVYAP